MGANIIIGLGRMQANACEQLVFVQLSPAVFGLISAIVKAQFWPVDEASTCSVKVGQGGVINMQGNTKQGSVLCMA